VERIEKAKGGGFRVWVAAYDDQAAQEMPQEMLQEGGGVVIRYSGEVVVRTLPDARRMLDIIVAQMKDGIGEEPELD
jgi:hypothetical protein